MKLRFTKYVLQSPKVGDKELARVRKKLISLEGDAISNSKVPLWSIRQKIKTQNKLLSIKNEEKKSRIGSKSVSPGSKRNRNIYIKVTDENYLTREESTLSEPDYLSFRSQKQRLRTRCYRELKQSDQRDEFEELLLEMIEINQDNKVLLTKKKILDKQYTLSSEQFQTKHSRSLQRQSSIFTLTSNRLPQIKRQSSISSYLFQQPSQTIYLQNDSVCSNLSFQKKRAGLAVKFLHRYVKNIFRLDYFQFAKNHSMTGSSLSSFTSLMSGSLVNEVKELKSLQQIQEQQITDELQYGYLQKMVKKLIDQDKSLVISSEDQKWQGRNASKERKKEQFLTYSKGQQQVVQNSESAIISETKKIIMVPKLKSSNQIFLKPEEKRDTFTVKSNSIEIGSQGQKLISPIESKRPFLYDEAEVDSSLILNYTRLLKNSMQMERSKKRKESSRFQKKKRYKEDGPLHQVYN